MPRPGLREWLACAPPLLRGNLLRHDGPLQLTAKFERRFAAHIGTDYALAMTSGTVALHAAVTACGIGPGDEVLVPAYTWIATAAAPVLAGAVPVLVDIDESLTIDPADIERKITANTKAIMPVHMVNTPCDMDAIMRIAHRHGLMVIEDACQAAGVRYKGHACGSIGDIGVFSFNQHKNMSIGEGGAVVTNDPDLYARMMNFHDLGIWARAGYDARNQEPFVSSHARLTEVQGAMLNVQLSRLPSHVRGMERRSRLVAKILEASGHLKLTPHNDEANRATVTVIFEHEAEAVSYAARRGVFRLFDNTKHVYTNWDPIMSRRTAHPKMNPWAWAHRDITYDASTCSRTLDILRRTCRFHISPRWPLPAVHWMAGHVWAAPDEQSSPGRPVELGKPVELGSAS
jgi:dTDP-4-amino-4,6-dideoxygalactose transaminase